MFWIRPSTGIFRCYHFFECIELRLNFALTLLKSFNCPSGCDCNEVLFQKREACTIAEAITVRNVILRGYVETHMEPKFCFLCILVRVHRYISSFVEVTRGNKVNDKQDFHGPWRHAFWISAFVVCQQLLSHSLLRWAWSSKLKTKCRCRSRCLLERRCHHSRYR
jgi:hypothetical protein